MSINDPYAPGTVRAPRIQILNNGNPVGGALSFRIHSNAYYQADTFTAEFAFNADPNFDLGFWGDTDWDQQNPLLLNIQASLDGGNTWTSLILGQVDHMSVHLEKGIVEVDGRDLTANFIDAKTQETFQNQTSSQIVETLAARHGMTADVTPTSTLVGRYYDIDHTVTPTAFSRNSTEWNLICGLAQLENFDAWVTGTTIHFHPHVTSGDPYIMVFDRAPPFFNAVELSVDRAMSFTKDISVKISSWNSRQAQPIVAYAGVAKATQFSYVFPNLSQAGAQAKADQVLASLQRHQNVLAFASPADLTLTPRTPLRLTGTGSSWDQVNFQIDSVERAMSFEEGFTMRVQAKNQKVAS